MTERYRSIQEAAVKELVYRFGNPTHHDFCFLNPAVPMRPGVQNHDVVFVYALFRQLLAPIFSNRGLVARPFDRCYGFGKLALLRNQVVRAYRTNMFRFTPTAHHTYHGYGHVPVETIAHVYQLAIPEKPSHDRRIEVSHAASVRFPAVLQRLRNAAMLLRVFFRAISVFVLRALPPRLQRSLAPRSDGQLLRRARVTGGGVLADVLCEIFQVGGRQLC
mmetsp:Transcript_18529/g.54795  ORF Transcript_18529/g.54795 Transcript_18529/m.54795 type:complete len:219 (-) Transcript_18529:307-963(-)